MIDVFGKTQYLIEKKRVALRWTLNVKDVNGNLLGYVKGQRLKPNYWFEDVEGTRLSEIRGAENYEVYACNYYIFRVGTSERHKVN